MGGEPWEPTELWEHRGPLQGHRAIAQAAFLQHLGVGQETCTLAQGPGELAPVSWAVGFPPDHALTCSALPSALTRVRFPGAAVVLEPTHKMSAHSKADSFVFGVLVLDYLYILS